MNNYIIDPSVFYWMNVLDSVRVVLIVAGVVSLIGFFSLAITHIYMRIGLCKPDDPDDSSSYEARHYERNMKKYREECQKIQVLKKWVIVTGIAGVVLLTAAGFIPPKQVSVEMLVARTATFDNVDWTVSQVKEIIDYIVSALKGAV